MKTQRLSKMVLLCGASALILQTGCSNMPGSKEQQGAVVGGLGGAVAGAAIGGEDNRLLGAIIGGALGAGGGYVVGANSDRILNKDKGGAESATQTAKTRPATAEDARNATTADLNSDGFVTLDEVIALDQAGYTDQQIVSRLEATGQVFELTPEQQDYLKEQGVSSMVVSRMEDLNREARDRVRTQPSNGVIGRPQ